MVLRPPHVAVVVPAVVLYLSLFVLLLVSSVSVHAMQSLSLILSLTLIYTWTH